jgi:two-component system, OmpR family, sensor histidine kinase KdpD
MAGFVAGLATGCLLGVGGTFLLILLATALSNKRPHLADELSPRGLVYPVLVLFAVAGISYLLGLDKAAVMPLLLLGVLAIAKLEGLAKGIGASAFAAGMLSFLFMPPIGSLKVTRPNDQLSLALFLLSAIFATRLAGKAKALQEPDAWNSHSPASARNQIHR